jgi:ATP-binding cassette subfamily B protein
VIALRTASGAVMRSMFAANQLYETTFYLDVHARCLADARTRTRRADGSLPPEGPHVIELSDVSFTYPGHDVPAIAGVSLRLRAGDVVALVGENGSGKTTLSTLLTGLHLPDTGSVTWDGVDIATLDPVALAERVALIPQRPLELPMTAADNVRVGRIDRPDPARVRLRECARRSGADDVVDRLPGGWDTVLSRAFDGGRDLSGGEWQRVGVARGLYRDAALVIADEPTAAMDARAERTVFAELCGAGDGTSPRRSITVLVTHRLANIRTADVIVVLRDGRIVESGTHDDLMRLDGAYAELFVLQSSGYGIDGEASARAA